MHLDGLKEKAGLLAGRLRRQFAGRIAPAVLLFVAGYVLHQQGLRVGLPPGTLRLLGIVLLVLAVAGGVAVPMLLRTVFYDREVRTKRITPESFEEFQRRLLRVSLSAAWLAGLAYLLLVPRLHLYGSVLAALYGVYSVLPARSRILADMIYFGLKEGR